MKNQLINIFENYGIDPNDPADLSDVDSLQYIAILVEIENTFKIELPDEYLDSNMFLDMELFLNNVCQYIESSADQKNGSNSGMPANTQ